MDAEVLLPPTRLRSGPADADRGSQGDRFLASFGAMPGIEIGPEFEFTDAEIDEMYGS